MKRRLDDDLFTSPVTAKKAKLILKDHFTDPSYLEFLSNEIDGLPSLASVIPSLIFGHSQFGEIFYELKHGDGVKLAILKLLKACFSSKLDTVVDEIMHEAHIPLLLGAYGAKLTPCDQVLFEILRLYEKRGGADLSKYYPLVWGEIGLKKYASLKTSNPALWNRPTTDDVLESLDPKIMKFSSLKLPLEIKCDTTLENLDFTNCYDPRFILPLFVNLLGPDSLVNLRRFVIERSCLGYTISCLSLHDPILRGAAYTVLYRLREYLWLPTASKKYFREKPQIVYILALLRQSITKPFARIPPLSTTFLNRAVQLTAMPWDSLYSTIHAYLLLKSRLDFGDVPEFYKLFQSASSADRFWILKLLADGIRESADYRVCERRDVFRLLFAFYDWAAASNNDSELASGQQILKIVDAVCRIATVASDFCYRYNLIGWLSGAIAVIKSQADVEELAVILRLIYENVLQKEGIPKYVLSNWHGVAALLKAKAIVHSDAKEALEEKLAWLDFSECFDSVAVKLGLE